MRRLHIAGWCVDRTGAWLHGIRALVGNVVVEGVFGIERPDVAANYPAMPAARRSGFVVTVEPPPGTSLLKLEVRGVDGIWQQFFNSEIIGTANARREDDTLTPEEAAWMKQARAPRIHHWFDRPADW